MCSAEIKPPIDLVDVLCSQNDLIGSAFDSGQLDRVKIIEALLKHGAKPQTSEVSFHTTFCCFCLPQIFRHSSHARLQQSQFH